MGPDSESAGSRGQVDPGTVTVVLGEVRAGRPGAREELFRLVHGELRRLADAKMRRQPTSDHTLQPTALVNEVYLRLMGGAEPAWEDRSQFFGAAARAMRSILVDFARSRHAKKRRGKRKRVTLDSDLRAHRVMCWSVAFSPDGTQIATGGGWFHGEDCTVRLWTAAPSGGR